MASNPLPPGERAARARSASRPASRSRSSTTTGAPLAAGEVGEVCVRGPGVVDGYLDNPEANAASFRDGWFRTGDRARSTPTATCTSRAGSRS